MTLGTPLRLPGRGRDVDGLLREIAALVREDDRLRARGADDGELERNHVALERLRWQLAHAVRRSAVADGPQAA
jgi:hypothetical protein